MTHWQKSKACRIDIAELAIGNELIRESVHPAIGSDQVLLRSP